MSQMKKILPKTLEQTTRKQQLFKSEDFSLLLLFIVSNNYSYNCTVFLVSLYLNCLFNYIIGFLMTVLKSIHVLFV